MSVDPSSDDLRRELQRLRFLEALGLPPGAPPAQILLAVGRLRVRRPELVNDLNLVQQWLIQRRARLEEVRVALAQAVAEAVVSHGPLVQDLMDTQGLDVLRRVQTHTSGPGSANRLSDVVSNVVRGGIASLQRLRVSPGDTRVTATAHIVNCPVCGGGERVDCPECGGSGQSERRSLSPSDVVRQIGGDPALLGQVRDAMAEQRVPSWVQPEEFVQIFAFETEAAVRCGYCRGAGRMPCPKLRELSFPVPTGARDGWVARSRETNEDGQHDYVRLVFL